MMIMVTTLKNSDNNNNNFAAASDYDVDHCSKYDDNEHQTNTVDSPCKLAFNGH